MWRIAIGVFLLLTIGSTRAAELEPDGYWTKAASKYNCEWVREKLKTYTEEELIKKAKRWHIPERIIELGKQCPR